MATLGVPPGAPLVVQVAQLVGHKDPRTLVGAIAAARRAVPALHALLVGDGRLRGAVEARVAALGLSDVVHLAGYRGDADSLLAAATVATLTSAQKGLGTVLLDALSMGRRTVATRAGGIPEIIEDGVSGLLARPGDAEAIGAAIVRALTDASLAARLAARRARTRRRVLGGAHRRPHAGRVRARAARAAPLSRPPVPRLTTARRGRAPRR